MANSARESTYSHKRVLAWIMALIAAASLCGCVSLRSGVHEDRAQNAEREKEIRYWVD